MAELAEGATGVVNLRRHETSVPWGFRMQGGVDYGIPLFVQRVNPRSLAAKHGLQVGDGVVKIGASSTQNMAHSQAKMEIIRAGNELDFTIVRGAVKVAAAPPQPLQPPAPQPRFTPYQLPQPEGAVIEEPSQYRGFTNPNAQSRSFKMLEMSLTDAAGPHPAPSQQASQAVTAQPAPTTVSSKQMHPSVFDHPEQAAVMGNKPLPPPSQPSEPVTAKVAAEPAQVVPVAAVVVEPIKIEEPVAEAEPAAAVVAESAVEPQPEVKQEVENEESKEELPAVDM